MSDLIIVGCACVFEICLAGKLAIWLQRRIGSECATRGHDGAIVIEDVFTTARPKEHTLEIRSVRVLDANGAPFEVLAGWQFLERRECVRCARCGKMLSAWKTIARERMMN